MVRILLVDDNATSRAVVRRTLCRNADIEIVECENGLEALESLSEGHFALVLLDMVMPVLDGFEVLQAIRDSAAFASIPVLVMTSLNDEDAVRRTIGLGVTGYLTKPIRPGELYDRVANLTATLKYVDAGTERPARAFEPLELDADSRILVVDSSAEFRQFFTKTVGALCLVEEASSGQEALRLCLEDPPYGIFIGSDLGLVNGELLVRKIRSSPRLDAMRVIGIQPPRLLLRGRKDSPYETVIMRSFVPEVFREGIDALIQNAASPAQLFAIVPDLKLLGIAAAEEAFSVALDRHVVLRPATPGRSSARSMAAAMVLHVGHDVMPLHIQLSASQKAASRLVRPVAEETQPTGDPAESALVSLVTRIGVLLRRELERRNLPVESDEPTSVSATRRTSVQHLDRAAERFSMAFDVMGGISFRLELTAGDAVRPPAALPQRGFPRRTVDARGVA